MNRRNVLLGIVVLAVLGGVYLAMGGGLTGGSHPTPTPGVPETDLDSIVAASGTLLPARRAGLSFRIAGLVTQVAAKVGDQVKEGDTLIKLESLELEAAAAQAKAAVAVAQAGLAQLKAGAGREDIAVAQAAVDTAQAQLAKVRAGSSVEEIALAQAALDRAQAAVRDAQAAYDRVRGDPNIGMFPESFALQSATMEVKIAQTRYDQVRKGASAEDIRIVETAVAAAQANLARVKAGARAEELAGGQARVDQAQAAYQQTQAALATATLTAPFSGTVAAVNVNPGETVAPGVSVVTLGDLANLRLETDDLSETSIGRVKVGQSVAVTFEALPGKIFKGTVARLAPMATQKQGGTNYAVLVEI